MRQRRDGHSVRAFVNRQMSSLDDFNATHVTTATIGVVFGLLSGINHGLFEVLQGNTSTDGLIFDAIGEAQRFWTLGGEPAFSVIPNFLITGIASMIVGTAIIIWSIWFLPVRLGRTVFLGLFVLSFLVGGGIGQVFFFVPAWAFATRMGKPLTWWRKALPRSIWPLLSRLWVATLILATIVLLIGLEIAIFGVVPGVTNPERIQSIGLTVVLVAALLYVVTYVAGFGHELQKMDRS